MQDFVAYPKRSKLAMMLVASLSFAVFGLTLMGVFGPFQVTGRFGTPISPQLAFAMCWTLGPLVLLFGAAGSFAILRMMVTGGGLIRIR